MSNQEQIRESYKQLEFDYINALSVVENQTKLKATFKKALQDAFIDGYLAVYYGLNYEPENINTQAIAEYDFNNLMISVTGRSVDYYINKYGFSDDKLINKSKLKETARSEIHRAFLQGQSYGADTIEKDSGTLIYKKWDATLDEKTRDTHFLLHGTTKLIDDYFETVNGKALTPGTFGIAEEDCNCRCILEFVEYGRD